MKLSEKNWVLAGGTGPEWRRVHAERSRQALSALRGVLRALPRAPASARARDYVPGLRYFLSRNGPERERLVGHPVLDYWLHLWQQHFALPVSEADWRLQLGSFQGLAASLALKRKDALKTTGALDPDGRFFFYGTPYYLQFDGGQAGEPFGLEISAKRTAFIWKGQKAHIPVYVLRGAPLKEPLNLGSAALHSLREAAPGIVVDDIGWLMLHGVTMHGRRRFASSDEAEAFRAVLARALSDMAARDARLYAELTDLTQVLVPLENPKEYGSVSSSYATLRGAICLSHSDDALLQAETLIHEFCHMKMNQLLAADPVLVPGQSGQVFYSPWRPDARRLRGLLLGAHAFLNVGLYLARSLQREDYDERRQIEVMVNAARRAEQVEEALRSLSFYASFTEFGRRFVLQMWRELAALRHAQLWYPPALVLEQKAVVLKHRREHALADTGLHKGDGVKDRIPRAPFLASEGQ